MIYVLDFRSQEKKFILCFVFLRIKVKGFLFLLFLVKGKSVGFHSG